MNMIIFNTLIELSRVEDLQNHNNPGATPLGLLHNTMKDRRKFMILLSWPQHINTLLSMEYAVKNVLGMDT